MNVVRWAAAAAAAAAIALLSPGAMAQAQNTTPPAPGSVQPGPGGQGMGGPGMMGGSGMGWRGWRWNRDTVSGWQLMTPEERAAHRDKMRSMRTYGECIAYQRQHRNLMEERAKARGIVLNAPRRNPCDMMRARGIIP